MNTDFDTLNLTNGGQPGFNPLQRTPLFPAGGSAPLSLQQQAMLRLLLGRVPANSPPYAQPAASGTRSGAAPPAGTPSAPPAMIPRQQVVRNPNGAANQPFVNFGNAPDGYAPGDPGAQAILSYGLGNSRPDDSLKEPLGFAPAPMPRYQVMPNPDAPARLRYGRWDNQLQDWWRDRFGFARGFSTWAQAKANKPTPTQQLGMVEEKPIKSGHAPSVPPRSMPAQTVPAMGPAIAAAPHASSPAIASAVPRPSAQGFLPWLGSELQAGVHDAKQDIDAGLSHLFPPAPGLLSAQPSSPSQVPPAKPLVSQAGAPMPQQVGVTGSVTAGVIDKPTSYYDHQLNEFLKPFPTIGPGDDLLAHIGSGQVPQYRGLLMDRDQAYLRDTDNALRFVQKEIQSPSGKTAANLQKYQQLIRAQRYYKARVAFDQIVGTMPGGDIYTLNCAIGAQQGLWLNGLSWDIIPHTESAGGMLRIVSSRKHDWQQVTEDQLEPRDLIFMRENPRKGSGWHVGIYMGPGYVAFQADSGLGLTKPIMRLAKYRDYQSQTQYGPSVYYHFVGQKEERTAGQPFPWPKGGGRGVWIGYRDPHAAPSNHPAGYFGAGSSNASLPSTARPTDHGGKPARTATTINQVYEAAKAAGDPHPAVTAAQWAWESGWGKRPSGRFNYFGITAPRGTLVATHEINKKGQKYPTRRPFRDFSSFQEGIQYHTRLVVNDYPGYKEAKTDSEAIDALVRHGYSPDPAYKNGLLSIIRRHFPSDSI